MPGKNVFKANVKGGVYKKPAKGKATNKGHKGIPPKYPQHLTEPKNTSTANLDSHGFAKTKPALVTQSGPYNRGAGLVG